jgi:hypothetical protein
MASAITKKGAAAPQESEYDQLNKRVKSLLSEEITNVSPFAKELYKKVRNNVKKLEDIKAIEEKIKAGNAKIDEAQREKLTNKAKFTEEVKQSLNAFEIYRQSELIPRLAELEATKKAAEAATTQASNWEVHKEEEKQTCENAATNTVAPQGQENKVVECSILQTPHPTDAKHVNATTNEAPPKQEVKLLVRDHSTSVEEAIRMIAPIFLILPSVFTIIGPHPLFQQASKLSAQDLTVL